MGKSRSHSGFVGLAMWVAVVASRVCAQEFEPTVVLPEFVLTEPRVALDEPASGYATVVSPLRFEPRVDLQTRNFGEAQGDVSIRGGIFEGTAIQVGGLTIYDPQTGHYAVELPVPVAMLGTATVMTGAEHAFASMQATAGTIDFAWRPITDGGRLTAGFGSGSLNRQSLYFGRVLSDGSGRGPRVAVDGEFSRSEARGTVPDGDHDFSRVAARMEIGAGTGQTRLFVGRQSKFFGWPNLYTPFGVAETEDIQTTLVILSHSARFEEIVLEAAGYFRRNEDDYEFDRYRPGLFNPYEHETRVGGAFAHLSVPAREWRLDFRGEVAADSIESTSLVAGRFNSRTYWKTAALASRTWSDGRSGEWHLGLGATFDDTNRDASKLLPMAELSWSGSSSAAFGTRGFLQFSKASRVPGYTTLNSPAGSGLFRGNPDLKRETAGSIEMGFQLRAPEWSLHAAVFRRSDDSLVDWTYSNTAENARSANAVAIDTMGVEFAASRAWSAFRLVVGYTWLDKDADYFGQSVDASFYALNFARHRITISATAKLSHGFEIRSDHELRWQESNPLRRTGGDSAVLGSVGLYWVPPRAESFEFSFIADNIWESDFQELPAVPAPGRQFTGGVTWRW